MVKTSGPSMEFVVGGTALELRAKERFTLFNIFLIPTLPFTPTKTLFILVFCSVCYTPTSFFLTTHVLLLHTSQLFLLCIFILLLHHTIHRLFLYVHSNR
ncbi:hypothetical protein BKA57DRAFT_206349 [Linnemannia elongata]|nr:hypothetical protein BKA57DRAFT_206349 [Linnemannia elongata]